MPTSWKNAWRLYIDTAMVLAGRVVRPALYFAAGAALRSASLVACVLCGLPTDPYTLDFIL